MLQTIPHYYLTVDCRVDNLMKLRAQLNEALASRDGGKLSVNDFVVKASALVSGHCLCYYVNVTFLQTCGVGLQQHPVRISFLVLTCLYHLVCRSAEQF